MTSIDCISSIPVLVLQRFSLVVLRLGYLRYTPFTLGHGNHVSGHRCRTSAKRD